MSRSPDDPSRPEAADGETLGDDLDIHEAAGENPAPPRRTTPPVPPAGDAPPARSGDTPESAPTIRSGAEPFELPFPESAAAEPAAAPNEPAPGRRRLFGRRRPMTGAAGATPADAGNAGKAAKAAKPRRKSPWWELPALIGLAIVIAILVKTFLIQPFYIPSQSMEKTLHGCQGCEGDRILVSKIIYDFRDPHPGDIVVFNAPPGWNDEPTSKPPSNPIVRVVRGFGQLIGFVPPDGLILVKRVIATGGQTVKGDADGNVYISDHGPGGPYRKLNETYKFIDPGATDTMAKFGPITVPKGRLWVMGDHRNQSADSRYHCGADATTGPTDRASCQPEVQNATVPVSDVIGKAIVIAWPPSRWTTLGTPKTFETASAQLGASGMAPLGIVAPVFFVVRRRRRRR